MQCFDEPFWIDKFEVMNAQFRAVTGGEPPTYRNGDLIPVNNINWFDARDFCQLRDARLPTEREWEYAARGPDSLTYPWGNTFISNAAVYGRSYDAGHEPIIDEGGNPLRPQGASWVGAVDMAGNVWEWTSTRYDDVDSSDVFTLELQGLYPYPYTKDDGRERDETVEEHEARLAIYTARVLRGGGYGVHASLLRAAIRDWYNPGSANFDIGFRCALSE
jgi:formylglycine-generating enzyme required for sulfatase activity